MAATETTAASLPLCEESRASRYVSSYWSGGYRACLTCGRKVHVSRYGRVARHTVTRAYQALQNDTPERIRALTDAALSTVEIDTPDDTTETLHHTRKGQDAMTGEPLTHTQTTHPAYVDEGRRYPDCVACQTAPCAACAHVQHLHERYNMSAYGMPQTPLCERHAPEADSVATGEQIQLQAAGIAPEPEAAPEADVWELWERYQAEQAIQRDRRRQAWQAEADAYAGGCDTAAIVRDTETAWLDVPDTSRDVAPDATYYTVDALTGDVYDSAALDHYETACVRQSLAQRVYDVAASQRYSCDVCGAPASIVFDYSGAALCVSHS